jgi:hypothetical protein
MASIEDVLAWGMALTETELPTPPEDGFISEEFKLAMAELYGRVIPGAWSDEERITIGTLAMYVFGYYLKLQGILSGAVSAEAVDEAMLRMHRRLGALALRCAELSPN